MDFNLEYFKEDYDLLEHVALEESYQDQLNELITESDVMISIYESQRFIVESNTKIFDALGYGVVTEGVLGKVWEVIKTIIRKIGEMIKKFIGFFTGGNKVSERKESDKKLEQNTKKAKDDIAELIKLHRDDKKYAIIKTDGKTDIKTLIEYSNGTIVRGICNDVQSLIDSMKYTFADSLFNNDFKSEEELMDLAKRHGISWALDKDKPKSYDEKQLLSSIENTIEIINEGAHISGYAKMYMQKNIDYFKDYSSNEIQNAMLFMKNIREKYIEKLEKAVFDMEKKYRDLDNKYSRIFISSVREVIGDLHRMIAAYINCMMTIERGYKKHENNILMASLELKKK